MENDVENRSKEIFEEAQARQAKYAKKAILGVLCGVGVILGILGGVFIILGDIFGGIGVVYLPVGLALVALGIILYFAIPTKYSYERYRARAQKYGVINIYSLNAKIAELEARIEELEKKNKD